MTDPRRDDARRTSGRRPPKPPGIGAISALAAVVVLVPGIVVYVALRSLGLGIGPAGVIGLFVMIGGMVAYPVLLRRTGWVGAPRRRPAPPTTDDGGGQR
ncbi:MAG: hypothetical protein QOJ32_1530 [Frankiaceae bacterium]|jgi:hypothetical protein|nr:hypothetical protein [Frankiaceae bacterium]MDQ1649395.1 hypothetical protein [Frankiaceae bacterium]